MSPRLHNDFEGVDELGRDVELADALDLLDPERRDPNYWLRFRAWVLNNAAAELARRRLMHELTVGDVMTSWARAVVPTAVLAAAVAGLLLVRGQVLPPAQPVGIEELLVSEVEGETIPAALAPQETGGAVAFASEIF